MVNPRVSVVIPARNAELTIATQISALLGQYDGTFEVILVDNGSTDSTVANAIEAARWMPLRVIREENPGVNFARNAGITAANSDSILLADADDVVSYGWVHSLSREVSPGFRAYGQLELSLLNSERTQKMHGIAGRFHNAGKNGSGCNCGFSKQDWWRVGGFNASLSGRGDETEFFHRMSLEGIEARYSPEAIVHFRLRSGLMAFLREKYRAGRSWRQIERLGLLPMPHKPGRIQTPFRAIAHLVLAIFSIVSPHRQARHLGAFMFYLALILPQIDRAESANA